MTSKIKSAFMEVTYVSDTEEEEEEKEVDHP